MLVMAMLLGCTAIAFADETTEPTRTPDYSFSQYSAKVGQWGPFRNDGSRPAEEGPQGVSVDGIGGEGTARHVTGGPAEGGYIFSFNDGFIGGTHGPNKEYSGAIDATEFYITYKSNCSIRTQFVAEYRVSGYTYESKGYTFPSTNGEVMTVTVPLSVYQTDGEDNGWIYNMRGVYHNGFNPVIVFKIHGIRDGNDITFEEFGFNWYNDDMVSGLVIEDYKTSYYQNYDEFDYSQGRIGIKRGGSDEVSEWITLTDPRVAISGYNNKNLNSNLTMTATVLNKKVTFPISIVEYKPDNVEKITIDNPKTSYLIQEEFDYKTGTVTAHFADGTTETVKLDNANVKITGFDSSSAADAQVLTVAYAGLTTTYEISVKEFEITGNITVQKPKRLYKVGDKFDWHTGMIVPDNGMSGKLFSKYATVSGFDSSAPVEDQVITVTYGGQTTTYTVDIIEDDIPIKYRLYQPIERTGTWKWGGNMYTLGPVANRNQEGDGYAVVIEGDGTHGGGGAIVFLGGDCGGGSMSMDDGVVLDGLKGADALVLDYINTFTKSRASNYPQYAPSFSFRAEYQNGTGTTVNTPGYNLPVTKTDVDDPEDTGYWVDDFVIDFREIYDNTDKSKETAESIDWLYNMKSQYINNSYAPSIQWRFGGKLLDGDTLAIDELYYAWYEDEPVSSIEVINPITRYFKGSVLDTSTTVKLHYKNGDVRKVPMSDLKVSGYDPQLPGKQTVTLSYAGKTGTFEVEVLEGGDDVISAVLSEDVRTVYLIGDEFDTSVGGIVITLGNGTQSVIPLSDEGVTITGFDSSTQNTKVPVTITYGENVIEFTVRVYKPTLQYNTPSFTDGDGATITSFGGKAQVNANIKVRNRVACETPQTAAIFAAVYNGNKMPLIKKLTDTPVPASSEIILTASFTADELANATSIKIIALDSGETIGNILDTAASINK